MGSIVKKLAVALGVALVIGAVGFVSIGAGRVIPLEFATGPRGGMIEFAILIFCASLVGLYWIVRVYIPNLKKRDRSEK